MNQTPRATPRSLYAVGIFALLWSLAGAAMFVMQVTLTPEAPARMEPAQRSVYAATPAILNMAFGIAVLAGILGSGALLVRRTWAVPAFLTSFVAVIVQMTLAFTMTPAWAVLGPAGLVMPVALIVVSGGFWLYARRATARGWLSGAA